MRTIYLNNSPKISMPVFSDEIEAETVHKKKWTFIGVYYLRELRDVFLVIRQYHHLTKKEVYQKVRDLVEKQNDNKVWQSVETRERDILEYHNALENLALIKYKKEENKFDILNFDIFKDSILNKDLSENDKGDFKNIFLNYSRFREVLNWFSQDFSFKKENLNGEVFENFDYNYLVNHSLPLYSFNRNSNKSVDSIIYNLEDNTPIYAIDTENKNFIRFWDVFTTIGEELGIMNSFSYQIGRASCRERV